MKIKQGDTLLPHATKANLIGHSAKSDGHLIYQPGFQNVSVERNTVFHMGEMSKLSPTFPSEHPRVSTYKRMQSLSQKSILMPKPPMCDLHSQPGEQGQIKEIIDSTLEKDLEGLQPSQQGVIEID